MSHQALMTATLLAFVTLSAPALEIDPALLVDRAAVERVYHDRRSGGNEPFEQALPPAGLRRLVQRDQRKEEALQLRYHVSVSAEQVAAEVRRIETSTRAPEVLAELKHALGNDPIRFARTIARPLVVDRLLAAQFEQDERCHGATRRALTALREQLIDAQKTGLSATALGDQLAAFGHGDRRVVTWPFGARTAEDGMRFEDLPQALRRVLDGQLQRSGDVTAVIETPESYQLYVALARTTTELRASSLVIRGASSSFRPRWAC